MPTVKTKSGIKHFPYTKEGMKAAMKAAQRSKGKTKKAVKSRM